MADLYYFSKLYYNCYKTKNSFTENVILELSKKDLYDQEKEKIELKVLFPNPSDTFMMTRRVLVCNYSHAICQNTNKKLRNNVVFLDKRNKPRPIVVLKSFVSIKNPDFPVAFLVLDGNKKKVFRADEIEFLPWM